MKLMLPSSLSASFSSFTEGKDPNDGVEDLEDITTGMPTEMSHNFETDLYLEKLTQDNEKVCQLHSYSLHNVSNTQYTIC